MEEEKSDLSTLNQSLNTLTLNDLSKSGDEENDNCTCSDRSSLEIEPLSHKEIEMKTALNQQTIDLYTQYAREQYPKDVIKQKELINEMQEQYFNHYLIEVYRVQIIHQQLQNEKLQLIQESMENHESSQKFIIEPLPLIPATIWTRKGLSEFKKEVCETQRECCIKIGSLATATIRVPTHSNGKAICWEFSTDNYDLGFGLYFEWDLEPQENMSVNIFESIDEEGGYDDDDDDEEEEEEENDPNSNKETDLTKDPDLSSDLERGHKLSQPRLPTDELIPIYRRDCHTNIYCGTHQYPGLGVYVFKFDNSFSLWRSKWLYYRIYYKS